jgi:hypothetical protein
MIMIISDTLAELISEFTFCFSSHSRPYRLSENDVGSGAPVTHLWRINYPLRVQVLSAALINATDSVWEHYVLSYMGFICIFRQA